MNHFRLVVSVCLHVHMSVRREKADFSRLAKFKHARLKRRGGEGNICSPGVCESSLESVTPSKMSPVGLHF